MAFYIPNLAMRLVLKMGEHVHHGTCRVVMPDGKEHLWVGKHDPESISATCIIHNDRFAWRLLVRGVLGFCEAYLDGDWSSPDMTALFCFAQQNERVLQDMILGHEWWRKIEGALHYFNRNTINGSRRNISAHYDLGNDFYEKWLDSSMTYSSGIFDERVGDGDHLAQSQENKYAQMAQMLRLNPNDHVLEIGCGWGGFAEYVARNIGSKVTGITISRKQYEYASRRIQQAGLNDRVNIELRDYRHLDGQFDKIASIEMFEAVGKEYWDIFFQTIQDRLLPNGIAAMQVITIADKLFAPYSRGADYIQKYIFPGGMLPTFTHLQQAVNKAGLQWNRHHLFGKDYARTLQEWRRRFHQAWPDLQKNGYDSRFKRMWEQYLCYCEAGFRQGSVDVCQIAFSKNG